MSNLPAPIDPNLLPALHEGLSLPYSREIFLIEVALVPQASPEFLSSVPAGFQLETLLLGGAIQVVTEGGTPLGTLDPERSEILVRLLEAGKILRGYHVSDPVKPRVRIHLREL
jgi:hypothetical protein